MNNVKFKMGYHVGMFDLIFKNETYNNLYRDSDKYNTQKESVKAYLKNVLIPYLKEVLKEVITEEYDNTIEIKKISYKWNKDVTDRHIIIEVSSDEYINFSSIAYDLFRDCMYYKLLNETNCIVMFDRMY